MTVLVTGSSGLIGSSVANYYLNKGFKVIGLDNNMRQKFFGKNGTTSPQKKILSKNPLYIHIKADIRNQQRINEVIKKYKPQAVVHCAGQPSHDKAKDIPLEDFEINTVGTLYLLEAIRKNSPETTFVFTSTNKVYGDLPNKIPLRETKTRYTYKNKKIIGINEECSIDQNTHSLMGASKAAADIYVQEYGKYFGLKTTCLRLGCVTGSNHAGVKLHGFLSFLIKSLVHDNTYEVIGYKGKQVRDQIHASDVATAINEIIKNPNKGEVFNLGGGPKNNASINELIEIISQKLEIKPKISYRTQARKGDHICYISDLTKFKKYYPEWKISKDLDTIINEIIDYEKNRANSNSRGKN